MTEIDILEAVVNRLWEILRNAKPTDNYRFVQTTAFLLEDELMKLKEMKKNE